MDSPLQAIEKIAAICAEQLSAAPPVVERPPGVTVSSSQGLIAALKAASPGDFIYLAPGEYGGLDLRSLNFDVPVVIEGGPGAVLTDLDARNCRGLTFQNLTLSTEGKNQPSAVFKVSDGQDFTFAGLHVHGSLNGDPTDDMDGLAFTRCKNVRVTDSEFEQLRIGIGHRACDGLYIARNHIHDLRMDGVRGGESVNVVITENYIHDFHAQDGDHRDAIQFYTLAAYAPGKALTVTANRIEQGSGSPIQGVFLRTAGAPFEDVLIEGNFIAGGNHNAIAVLDGSERVKIRDNQVVGELGWIRVNSASQVEVVDNVVLTNSSKRVLLDGATQLDVRNNRDGSASSVEVMADTSAAWAAGRPGVPA